MTITYNLTEKLNREISHGSKTSVSALLKENQDAILKQDYPECFLSPAIFSDNKEVVDSIMDFVLDQKRFNSDYNIDNQFTIANIEKAAYDAISEGNARIFISMYEKVISKKLIDNRESNSIEIGLFNHAGLQETFKAILPIAVKNGNTEVFELAVQNPSICEHIGKKDMQSLMKEAILENKPKIANILKQKLASEKTVEIDPNTLLKNKNQEFIAKLQQLSKTDKKEGALKMEL